MGAYVFFALLAAYFNFLNGWKFLPAFILSICLTPVAGFALYYMRGIGPHDRSKWN
jgi:phosphate/sulfate permease